MALRHAKPGEIVDLGSIGPDLGEVKTAAIIKVEHFEAIRLIVHASTEILQHSVSGDIMLHCLEEHVELGLDPKRVGLRANE